MQTSVASDGKITPLFVLQSCVITVVILIVALRPAQWDAARLAGLCIVIPSAVLFVAARWQLGRSFSVTPQARELVTRGVYSKVRNPIYVSGALMPLGILIALHARYAFLFLLVVIPIQVVRARKEAQVLEARFGEEYRTYRNGTWF